MKILVTEEDITGAEANCCNNPISRALERQTGHRWYVYHSGAVSEIAPLYRTKFLDAPTYSAWSAYQKSGYMQPLEFELDFR